jgi:hypothetical protein
MNLLALSENKGAEVLGEGSLDGPRPPRLRAPALLRMISGAEP